ncbi:mediator-associated protein 1-like [Solanum tuberosum]|uniref:Transcription regulator n=1 Tax=Solanum tuberosum TaxID=4113 RepID=M0ZVR8_SOLTU|nr:PREDICTED: mediator-associated protein 1-like [Solanum tuberosum]
MASLEDQAVVYNDDDLDDEEDDEESGPPQNEAVVDEDDDVDVEEEEEEEDDSTSSPPVPVSNHSGAGEVTIAVVGVPATDSLCIEPKRERINDFGVIPATIVVEEKKPLVLDDSRKLFQRLWMDEDEIELLQGFLEYTTQRGGINSSSHHHHDTGAFYDQIKNKLQLDFNKNQLVEKLRRLKKKYRTVMSKMGSGKEFVFKSPHDQATFEISRKIWSNAGPIVVRSSGPPPPPPDDGGFDDEDSHLNLNNANFIDHSPNFNLNPNGIDVKTPKSKKRSRGGTINSEEKPGYIQQYYQPSGGATNVILPATPVSMAAPQATAAAAASIPSLIEETVRSCLSPIFKELFNNLKGSRYSGFGMSLGPTPLGFGNSSMSSDINMKTDEKWRKQQILELEVYSKRLELVQDQIKAQLEELRSMSI